MITLITVSALGFICLILEILNLRKILVPVVLVGLALALGFTLSDYLSKDLLMADDTYGMIVSTGYSQMFSVLFILLALFIIAMSPSFYKDRIEKIADYISLKLFLLAGAIAMVSYAHLAMFFLGLEVLSIAGYVLAASSPTDVKSNEAGMKYFLMGAFASGFVVFGIALLYGSTGSFNIDVIEAIFEQRMATSVFAEQTAVWGYVGATMIIVGLLFKVSAAPFHFWAPDVYEGSPRLVTALMSTLIKVAAIAALCKIGLMVMPTAAAMKAIIVAISILTMTVGNVTALRQSNIRRMMAYSGISHAGFMVMALLRSGGPGNTTLYYAVAYSLAGIAAFAVILAVCEGKDNEDIDNFDGLAKRNPLLALIMAGAMLSLGGIPIFGGFFAKLFTFGDMLDAGHISLVVFGVLNSIIALYYYLKIVNVMYTKPNYEKHTIQVDLAYKIVAISAISLNLLIGLFPYIIMGLKL